MENFLRHSTERLKIIALLVGGKKTSPLPHIKITLHFSVSSGAKDRHRTWWTKDKVTCNYFHLKTVKNFLVTDGSSPNYKSFTPTEKSAGGEGDYLQVGGRGAPSPRTKCGCDRRVFVFQGLHSVVVNVLLCSIRF